MNLQKLFDMQKVLDDRIIKEKGLEGKDLVPNTYVALQVELAEMANEGRWFKHWKTDKSPRMEKLLEEFVGALHFFLSIAIQKGWEEALWVYEEQIDPDDFNDDLTSYYLEMVYNLNASYMRKYSDEINEKFKKATGFTRNEYEFRMAWILFLNIGINGFGFTPEQIESAYIEKNQVNHQRQTEGY